ncbi:lipoyl(octanoyl) transferase LipB [Cyanobium sp. Candia 9D4]|uniref:lipoyl(octanoyl) transferase LipB n=1 Tax=Cyanobium sp. Candia 9D4 TaxID=2823707 RepID=UPI0020CF5097|nr:lipoyl(octanoyl) transferase LipB [Cyanobium sp. Candia 9D4]MCP9934785.1 lipoyl(octanoyl) transferase LipB [Cyanobium sp. Candia 9D4]
MAPNTPAILFEARSPVPFPLAWEWQRRLQRRRLDDPAAPDALLLLQHTPCYTLGRGASLEHLGFDPAHPPLPLYRIDRGGEVTHHLPGQLVLYPVLDLQCHGGDLHLYLRALEDVVLAVLQELGLEGERLEGLTGVWLEGRKLAAIGVGARRWISQHGLALNVDCPLEGFGAIVPCGLAGRPVGRLVDWRPALTSDQVAPLLLAAFARRFGVALRPPGPQEGLAGLGEGGDGSGLGES